jgi:hypothetical protein
MEVSGQLQGFIYLRGKSPRYPWVGSRAGLDVTVERKILPLSGLETLSIQTVSIPTELSRLAPYTDFMYLMQIPHNKCVLNPPQFWQAADITKQASLYEPLPGIRDTGSNVMRGAELHPQGGGGFVRQATSAAGLVQRGREVHLPTNHSLSTLYMAPTVHVVQILYTIIIYQNCSAIVTVHVSISLYVCTRICGIAVYQVQFIL